MQCVHITAVPDEHVAQHSQGAHPEHLVGPILGCLALNLYCNHRLKLVLHHLLQVALRWAGDANIAIAVELPAGGDATRMVPKVSDVRINAVARVTLAPLVGDMPGFGAAVVSLRCHPSPSGCPLVGHPLQVSLNAHLCLTCMGGATLCGRCSSALGSPSRKACSVHPLWQALKALSRWKSASEDCPRMHRD